MRHEQRADVCLNHVVDASRQQAQSAEALQVLPIRQSTQAAGILKSQQGRHMSRSWQAYYAVHEHEHVITAPTQDLR